MVVCKECSSQDILELKWVGVNSGKIEPGIDDMHSRWCETCESHVEFMTSDML